MSRKLSVLDACAVIAFLAGNEGAERVKSLLDAAAGHISFMWIRQADKASQHFVKTSVLPANYRKKRLQYSGKHRGIY